MNKGGGGLCCLGYVVSDTSKAIKYDPRSPVLIINQNIVKHFCNHLRRPIILSFIMTIARYDIHVTSNLPGK